MVGQRVVVRRLVPGETGPTGGPAFTDVLGVCERWGEGEAVIRREDGTTVSLETRLIVSGKPVPPRATRLARVSREEIDAHLTEPGAPVWLGALAQLVRRCGAIDGVELAEDAGAITCTLGEQRARGVLDGDWLVVDLLDDPTLLGSLLERAAEEGVRTVAVTDPRVADVAGDLELLGR